jgi:hypothetical protein
MIPAPTTTVSTASANAARTYHAQPANPDLFGQLLFGLRIGMFGVE